MPSVSWYARRLRSMSVPELAWRLRHAIQSKADKWSAESRQTPPSLSSVMNGEGQAGIMRRHLFGDAVQVMASANQGHLKPEWKQETVRRAELLAEHVLPLFDLETCSLGSPVNWNFEYKANRTAPLVFAAEIDYRDHDVTGDCKFVWEPNRHHHWVTLGRAYRYTGDERYARVVVEQWESWLHQCPFGMGMNWRSPLELGIRLINWVWALELVRTSPELTPERIERIVATIYLHIREITRKYSRFSSANNHLIGEAAGVYIASTYCRGLKNARRWREEAKSILEAEILRQTFPDGGTREQALGYQTFVLQFFLLSALAGRNDGDSFSAEYWRRMEKMFEFLATFDDAREWSPLFGDSDDGYVLDLGTPLGHPQACLSIGAVLFERTDLAAHADAFPEAAYWLLGEPAEACFEKLKAAKSSRPARSLALEHTGYYVLRCGRGCGTGSIRAVFDCGELGYESIAAHGHADALSLTVHLDGWDLMVDSGTFDYFTYPEWRTYFRSTRAHNTVEIDGLDQSEMLGAFLWGRKARSRCLHWEPKADGGCVTGEHDGYHVLDDPVTHRRTVRLNGDARELTITDRLEGKKRHSARVLWHLSEYCRIEKRDQNVIEVTCGDVGRAVIEMDPRLHVSVIHGGEDPIMGWVSRGYHRKTPSSTIIGSVDFDGPTEFSTGVALGCL